MSGIPEIFSNKLKIKKMSQKKLVSKMNCFEN